MSIPQNIISIGKKMEIKLLQKSVLLNLKVNLTTKVKTHYETLGVTSTATYNEIKTAYYELTLKYHPDKNKSESAKRIFHEISNAYDVLSKYETRKRYDRTISVKDENTTCNVVDRQKPKETVFYPTPGMEKIYNFDEWVQNHYAEAFKHNLSRKEQACERKQTLQKLQKGLHSEQIVIAVIIGLVVMIKIYQNLKKSRSKEINSK